MDKIFLQQTYCYYGSLNSYIGLQEVDGLIEVTSDYGEVMYRACDAMDLATFIRNLNNDVYAE